MVYIDFFKCVKNGKLCQNATLMPIQLVLKLVVLFERVASGRNLQFANKGTSEIKQLKIIW